MNLKEYIIDKPVILTISPTHKCTSRCEQCCFGCTPDIDFIMDIKEMKRLVDESTKAFPTIKLFVVSGGECFLLKEKLDEIIFYAHNKGLKTRVVTNGYWATSYKQAYIRLKKLAEAGLNEISISTGDNHLQYVDIEYIKNAIKAAAHLNLTTAVSIEGSIGSIFNVDLLKKDDFISSLINDNKLIVLTAAWINFRQTSLIEKNDQEKRIILNHGKRPCRNLFKGISYNPYSQLLACCGLTVEYNPYLKLGDSRVNNIKELYESQYSDLLKIWLYIDGPQYLYELVKNKKGEPFIPLNHDCAYCIEICRNDNINILRNILKEELPKLIYKLQIEKIDHKNILYGQKKN